MTTFKYWIPSTSSNYNSSANWSLTSGGTGGAGVPGLTDAAVFTGDGLGSCSIDTDVNIDGLFVDAGYKGQIDQSGHSISIKTDAVFNDGTFINRGDTTVYGDIILEGARFINAGNLAGYGDFNCTVPSLFNDLGDGAIKLISTNSSFYAPGVIFNDLEIDASTSDNYLSLDSSCTVNRSLILSGGTLRGTTDGTINAKGDIYCKGAFGKWDVNHNAYIKVNGTGDQRLYTGGILPTIDTVKIVNNSLIIPKSTFKTVFGHAAAVSSDGKHQLITSYGGTFNSAAPGYLYTSDNYGASWTRVYSAPQTYWYTGAMSADGKYQYATYGRDLPAPNSIYRSADYGKTWISLIIPPINIGARWNSIFVSDTGETVLISNNKGGIYYSHNYGVTFNLSNAPQFNVGPNWACVTGTSDGMTAYATGDTTCIWKSLDGGVTWGVIPGNLNNVTARWSGIASSSDGKCVTVAVGALESKDAFTIYSRLMDSTDYGMTFSPKLNISIQKNDIAFIGSTITTVTGNFITSGFYAGLNIAVAGTLNNNTSNPQTLGPSPYLTIQTVAAKTLTIKNKTFTAEAAGRLVTIGAGWSGIYVSPDGTNQTAWMYPSTDYLWNSSDVGQTWAKDLSKPAQMWWDVAKSSDGSYVNATSISLSIEVNKYDPWVTAYGTEHIYVNGNFLLTDGTFNTNGLDIRAFGNIGSVASVTANDLQNAFEGTDGYQDAFDKTSAEEFWMDSF